jgi:hypothetical protein
MARGHRVGLAASSQRIAKCNVMVLIIAMMVQMLLMPLWWWAPTPANLTTWQGCGRAHWKWTSWSCWRDIPAVWLLYCDTSFQNIPSLWESHDILSKHSFALRVSWEFKLTWWPTKRSRRRDRRRCTLLCAVVKFGFAGGGELTTASDAYKVINKYALSREKVIRFESLCSVFDDGRRCSSGMWCVCCLPHWHATHFRNLVSQHAAVCNQQLSSLLLTMPDRRRNLTFKPDVTQPILPAE